MYFSIALYASFISINPKFLMMKTTIKTTKKITDLRKFEIEKTKQNSVKGGILIEELVVL